MAASRPVRLYDFLESGNGYKVRLLLSQLGVEVERIELDILNGKTRTPDFLAKNPNGRIPLLEFEDGRMLAESSAIQFYLAAGTPFLPDDEFERALVLQPSRRRRSCAAWPTSRSQWHCGGTWTNVPPLSLS